MELHSRASDLAGLTARLESLSDSQQPNLKQLGEVSSPNRFCNSAAGCLWTVTWLCI